MDRSDTPPVGALARGLLAGIAGTALMGGSQKLASTFRNSGSENSQGSGEQDWSKAPAPAHVAKRIIEGLFKRDVSPEHIDLLASVTHWTYGISWGAIYGAVQGSLRAPPVAHGLAFGSAVWGSAYVLLPAMKLYKPPWEYPPKTLAIDLSHHLAYGLGVAAAYRALEEM